MALFFNKVQRINPLKPADEKKWYPVLKSIGKVSEKEVAKQISDETTLNPKEAEMAIYQLEKVLKRLLLDGHTVQLGELGSFSLTINSESSTTEAEVSAAKIKKVNLRFRAAASLQEALDKATFTPVTSLASATK